MRANLARMLIAQIAQVRTLVLNVVQDLGQVQHLGQVSVKPAQIITAKIVTMALIYALFVTIFIESTLVMIAHLVAKVPYVSDAQLI